MNNSIWWDSVLAQAAAAVLLICAAAEGRTYHVAVKGDDSNSGSAEAPLATIQKAVSLARAGDTVLVGGGEYKGHVILQHSGEEGKPIVLKNARGEKPVLDGEGRGRIELKSENGWRKAIGWITIEGIEVKNGWDGIKFYNAHNIVLRGNYLHDSLNQGILGNGHHVRIEGNTIAHNGFKADNERSNLEHGIYCTGTDFTIVNNVIHSNKAYGVQIAGYPHKPEDQPGPEFGGARRWLVSHNTIALNQNRAGIVIWQREAAECVIQNNLFYKNSATLGRGAVQGIDFVGAGSGHVIRNNLFFAPGREAIGEADEEYQAKDNIEGQDPRFVNAERFDFHLQKGSPAIDAGTSEKAIETDIEGTKRPQGRGYDIAAYEHRQ
jgi:hypothetical protein